MTFDRVQKEQDFIMRNSQEKGSIQKKINLVIISKHAKNFSKVRDSLMKRGNEQSWWYVLTGGEPRQDRECKEKTLCESDLNKRKRL